MIVMSKRSRLTRSNGKPRSSKLRRVTMTGFLDELKSRYTVPKAGDTWLQNQYPALPLERLDKRNYMNYANLEKFTATAEWIPKIKKLVRVHSDVPIVVLARLDASGRFTKPMILVQNDALYYPQYELFASAYHLKGFVELFHNQKRSGGVR